MTYTYTDAFGSTYAVYVVTQTHPGTIFEFIMFGDSASKTTTDDLLDDFPSTFSTG